MKTVLILFLLFTSLNCNSLDIAKCILTNEKTISIVTDVISSLKEKNWTNFVSTFILYYKQFESVLIQCFEEDEEKEKKKEYDKEREEKCLEECKDLVDYHEREECWKDCYYKY